MHGLARAAKVSPHLMSFSINFRLRCEKCLQLTSKLFSPLRDHLASKLAWVAVARLLKLPNYHCFIYFCIIPKSPTKKDFVCV